MSFLCFVLLLLLVLDAARERSLALISKAYSVISIRDAASMLGYSQTPDKAIARMSQWMFFACSSLSSLPVTIVFSLSFLSSMPFLVVQSLGWTVDSQAGFITPTPLSPPKDQKVDEKDLNYLTHNAIHLASVS